ncbi:MAG: ArsB/NhaD family transporter [Nitrososphaerales archaeon]
MILVVLGIFIITYALLIFRKLGKRKIPIWVSMTVGALLMVGTLSISPLDAFNSIDFRVISFLFGILVISSGFEQSGLIEYLILSILRRSKNLDRLMLGVIFGAGLLAAFLVNDGLALLITPLALGISSKLGLQSPRSVLIPIAFGITTGSAFTPIGNPQNLLVTLNSGMPNPFGQFALYLLAPSLISLLAIFFLSKLFFKKDYSSTHDFQKMKESLSAPRHAVRDPGLARLSATALVLLIASFIMVEIFTFLQSIGFTFGNLALGFGIIVLILSPRRLYLLTGTNWGILIFFAGMFVVMRGVWDSNIGSALLSFLPKPGVESQLQSTGAIMFNSVLLSQILSNVPFVQLYTFEMHALSFTSSSTIQWLALAAGSTLAGNLTLLGAVSNVIILDSSEARGQRAFSFFEFMKYGVVATLVTCLIFFAFLVLT